MLPMNQITKDAKISFRGKLLMCNQFYMWELYLFFLYCEIKFNTLLLIPENLSDKCTT